MPSRRNQVPQRIRKAIRKQLGYLKRNLHTLDIMASEGRLKPLSKRLYRLVLVIKELYRQQVWMYENRSHRIADRIVSIYQPPVRPIVRGKAQSPVEFGAKLSVSLVDGFSFVDTLSWDAFNESGAFISQIEAYRQRLGFYPESVHADNIYRTRENRGYCNDKGIRLSGSPLGRPRQVTESNKRQLEQAKQMQRQDEPDRIPIEGKFGQGKRRFSLDRTMAKLAETSEAVIMVSFIVMNLEKILSRVLLFVLNVCLPVWTALRWVAWRTCNRMQWRYCQMLWMDFFPAQERSRFAGCFDFIISPASEARFRRGVHLASAGG